MRNSKLIPLLCYAIFLISSFSSTLHTLPSVQVPTPLSTATPTQTTPTGALPTGTTQPVGQPTTTSATPVQAVVTPLVLQYSTEAQIKTALSECASPTIPVFGATVADKSKYLIYEAIFKALTPALYPQLSFETKLKIQRGLLDDLVEIVLKTTDINKPTDITLKNITDISNLLGPSLISLSQINSDLSKLTSSDVSIWKDRFQKIYTESSQKKDKLAAKLTLQTDFFKKLEETQALQPTQLKEKRDRLLYLATTFLSKDIISSLRDDFFNNVSRLVNSLQSGTDDQKNIAIKLLDDLLKLKTIFSTAEQDKIKALKQVITTPVQPAAGAVPGQPAGIIAPAAQAQAPQIVTPSATIQPVAAGASQAPIVAATPIPKANILNDALNALNTAGTDPDKLLDACTNALDALGKIPSLTDKQKLAQKIQEKINFVYDKRVTLKNDTLTKASALFNKALTIDIIKAFITPQKINTLKVAILLNNAYKEEKNFSKFATELKKVVDALTKDVSNYEKTRLSDGIDSSFVNRKNDDVKKAGADAINPFKELLDALTAPTFKAKGVYSDSIQNKFVSYSKIISALLILLKPTQAKDLKTQIDYYRPTLDALAAPDTDYEKDLFFDIYTHIYADRGNFDYNKLDMFKKFSDELMNKQGLLSLAARSKMESEYLSELTNALSITPKNADPNAPDPKLYLEALIETSMNLADFTKNVAAVYPKIFGLFTSDTPVRVINTFLIKLNALMEARKQLDKQKLLSFLLIKKLTIDKTGINEIASMLPDKQKDTLKVWITTLKNEIQAGTGLK